MVPLKAFSEAIKDCRPTGESRAWTSRRGDPGLTEASYKN